MASLVRRAERALMGAGRTNAARDAGGRLESVEALYRLHSRRVYTLCLRLLADARVAEDATASAFVQLGRENVGRRDDAQTLDRLLDQAVVESISRLGASYRDVGAANITNASPLTVDVARASGPLDAAMLDHLTARLPARMRVAFILRDVEGFGGARVAAIMGVGEVEVQRLVRAARVELRRLWLGQT